MSQHLSHDQMLTASKFIEENYGIFFDEDKSEDLRRLLDNFAASQKFTSTDKLIETLISCQLEKFQEEALISSLTTGESYFYREPEAIIFFEAQLKKKLMANSHQRVSIWSAACCCGQEPYTLAIAARKHAEWHQLKILGTDLNQQFINVAKAGIFSPWSFRNAPPNLLEDSFKRTNSGMYQINKDFTENVSFLQHNLILDCYPDTTLGIAEMDFIFCRNVFIYFQPNRLEQIFDRFWHCLKPGGFLIIGVCEAQLQNIKGFSRKHSLPIGVFRKENNKNFLSHSTSENFPPVANPGFDKNRVSKPVKKATTNFPPAKPAIESLPAKKIDTPEEPIQSQFEQLLAMGKYHKLLEQLNQQTSILQDHQLLFLKAKCEYNLDQFSKALETVDQAIKLFRSKAEFHYFRALVLLEQDKFEESQKSLQLVLYLDENHLPAYMTLSNVLRKQGKEAEAKKFLNLAFLLASKLDENSLVDYSDGMTVFQLKTILTDLLKKTA